MKSNIKETREVGKPEKPLFKEGDYVIWDNQKYLYIVYEDLGYHEYQEKYQYKIKSVKYLNKITVSAEDLQYAPQSLIEQETQSVKQEEEKRKSDLLSNYSTWTNENILKEINKIKKNIDKAASKKATMSIHKYGTMRRAYLTQTTEIGAQILADLERVLKLRSIKIAQNRATRLNNLKKNQNQR